jgi:5-methylcytosine-specific restriction enzyme subunit McrC
MMVSNSDTVSAQATEFGIPIRNVWHMLLYAWDETRLSHFWQMVDSEDSPSLDALLALILVRTLQQRLRIGLGRNYMATQQLLRGIRGRIDLTSSVKQRTFERGQAFCKFEEYSINVPKNQIIRSTLHYLAQMGSFGPDGGLATELRHRLRLLTRELDGIDLVELTPDVIRRQLQHQRHDQDYRIMLAICDFVLSRRMPTEWDGYSFRSQLERNRLILHRVYQRFVTNFYRYHLKDWVVLPEQPLQWQDDNENPRLPRMRPDLTLRIGSPDPRMIVLDTKFTAKSLIQNQWGKEMFDSAHLYQIYAYLKTQEHRSELHMRASGVLLYPAIREELKEVITLPNHPIYIECVDLAAPWQTVEQRLMDVVLSKPNP